MENCIYCKSDNIVKAGKNKYKIQRYICRSCSKHFNENTDPNIGIVVNNKKYCSKCKLYKPTSEFKIINNKKLYYCCKKCTSKLSKARYGNHNMTESQFIDLINNQKNKCSICENDFKSNRHAYIDHNHKSGENRGLLCPKCNTLLGACNDDIKILNNAINYLIKYN